MWRKFKTVTKSPIRPPYYEIYYFTLLGRPSRITYTNSSARIIRVTDSEQRTFIYFI